MCNKIKIQRLWKEELIISIVFNGKHYISRSRSMCGAHIDNSLAYK